MDVSPMLCYLNCGWAGRPGDAKNQRGGECYGQEHDSLWCVTEEEFAGAEEDGVYHDRGGEPGDERAEDGVAGIDRALVGGKSAGDGGPEGAGGSDFQVESLEVLEVGGWGKQRGEDPDDCDDSGG